MDWVSVSSEDGFLWFAHRECFADYDPGERTLRAVPVPEEHTDRECEICSDLPHEDRVNRRWRLIDSGEIPKP